MDPNVDCIYIPLLGRQPVWSYNLNKKNFRNLNKSFKMEKINNKKIKINCCLDIINKDL